MSSYKKTENPENEKIKILNCSNSYKEAEQIVSFIKAMQEKKQNNRSDYAILYRKNALSQPFEQCLLEK
jgi:superfamily I DNA and RNA helicases